MNALDTQVAIVGAGPTGLSLATALSEFSIDCKVLERHSGPPDHPRATLVNTRTMEVLRSWGLAEEIRQQGLPLQKIARITWVSTLAGAEIGHLDLVENAEKLMQLASQSPEMATICAQPKLQSVLAAHLNKIPSVALHYECEAHSLIEAHDYIDLHATNSTSSGRASEETYRARYVVIAEGANGLLRESLSIAVEQGNRLGRLLDIYFRADLSQFISQRESALYWIINAKVRGVLITVDPHSNEWLLEIPALDAQDEQVLFGNDLDYEELVRQAVGDNVDVEVLSIRPWEMSSVHALNWRSGRRTLLAGDAAHTFAPTGGFGMNTGIQDAHNLAWKLAAVLKGEAEDDLLDTYELERSPVAKFNAQQSEKNALAMKELLLTGGNKFARKLGQLDQIGAQARASLDPILQDQRCHFDFQGQALGFSYLYPNLDPSRPLIGDIINYTPRACLGDRAPHVWLQRDETRASVLDIATGRFKVLVCAMDVAFWRAQIQVIPQSLRPEIVPIGTGEWDAASTLDTSSTTAVYELHDCQGVLIRPDGHIAARLTARAEPNYLLQAIEAALHHGFYCQESS